MKNLFRTAPSFVFVLLCLVLFSCSEQPDIQPESKFELEGTTWTADTGSNQSGEPILSVIEFKESGMAFIYYRGKNMADVVIGDFPYTYNTKVVVLRVHPGPSDSYSQQGSFVDNKLLLGGYIYSKR